MDYGYYQSESFGDEAGNYTLDGNILTMELTNGETGDVSYYQFQVGPNDTLIREQMAAVLYRYARYKGIDTSGRTDISRYSDAKSVSSYAFNPICWANCEGLIAGTSATTLSPSRTITRAEAAAIFMRFCDRFDVQ